MRGPAAFFRRAVLLCLLAAAALAAAGARAADVATEYPQVRTFFPAADRFGPFEGTPPEAAAYRGGELLGYAFLTSDVVRIPAYEAPPPAFASGVLAKYAASVSSASAGAVTS